MSDFIKLNGYVVRDELAHSLIDNLSENITTANMKIIMPNKGHNADTTNTGDCTVIQYKSETFIIDFGRSADYATLKNNLLNEGITAFTGAIISHYHSDHIGGLNSFLTSGDFDFSACKFYLPPTLDYAQMLGYNADYPSGMNPQQYEQSETDCKTLILAHSLGYVTPAPNSYVNIDSGLKIKFFNNDPHILANYYNIELGSAGICDLNNFSICSQFIHGQVTCLLPGDIAADAQAEAVSHIDGVVNIYKIEHHGFNTTNNTDWVKRINPDIVLLEGHSAIERTFNDIPIMVKCLKIGSLIVNDKTNLTTIIVSNGKAVNIEKYYGDPVTYAGITRISFVFNPIANSSVTPFSYFREGNIQSYIDQYGQPIGLLCRPASSTNAATACYNGTNTIRTYSAKAGDIYVYVTFAQLANTGIVSTPF